MSEEIRDSREKSVPAAPAYETLPTARHRTARSGPTVAEIAVRAEVVTPILGGSSQTRTIDDIDVVRPATVRGHLRFWWRALRGHEFASPGELYLAESALWGHAATAEGGRSAVEVRIAVEVDGSTDDSNIRLYDSRDGKATPGAYALWPARSEQKTNTPPAPRRQPGTRFQLLLTMPEDRRDEVCNVVRAWLLFGGYGGRTRRGLGSLKVVGEPETWLPAVPSREAINALFGRDIFAPPDRSPIDLPWLGGASLQIGKPEKDAVRAWTTALDWLKEFRQGTSGQPGDRAREPGFGKPQHQRPSVSNWPEADKVRHLSTPRRGLPWAHTPRHNMTPAWPRAGFGLPIIGQFQSQSRTPRPHGQNGPRNLLWHECTPAKTEPDGFELRWCSGGQEYDRLASPLIVKALPLADGTFVPCALWLNRAYPAGVVILKGVPGSAAPFEQLLAQGDTPCFSALAGKNSLREAFLDWLHKTCQTMVVAP